MATWYTNVASNQQTGLNFPAGNSGVASVSSAIGGFNDPVYELGNVDCIVATYTMVGTEVATDVINIGWVNSNAMVNPLTSWVATSASLGTTAAVQVGDADPAGASATRYSTALTVTSATQVQFTGGAAAATPYNVSADSWLTATFSTLSVPVAGSKITFWIQLVCNR